MVEAVVEYDYVAQEEDELTIRKGDVIRDIVKKPGGWWEGTLRDKRGMFPDNFVTVIVKTRTKLARAHTNRRCRALFSYHPAHDDELRLAVGDVIEVLGEVEEGWWRGRIGDQEGVFPSNFVAEITQQATSREDLSSNDNDATLTQSTPSPFLPPKPSKIICQVKYGYEACNEDELTLKEGDLITLISKDGQDPGWWRGELNGRVGVFPDNFVVVIPAAEVNGPTQPITIPNSVRSVSKSPVNVQTDHGNVAAQRKSLDLKTVSSSPPIPGKKPSVPKKSPSPSTTSSAPSKTSGVMEGFKKLVDFVDGAASSRLKINHDTEKSKEKSTSTTQQNDTSAGEKGKEDNKENDFDHVERGSMLSDMRQNRAKRPQGRRPPSQLYPKEGDMVNGNVISNNEHNTHDADENQDSDTVSNDEGNADAEERKPKVREWEKNKAPWMAELKQNQAKRTTVALPNRTPEKVEATATATSVQDELTTPPRKISETVEKSPSGNVDMSKSMSSITTAATTTTTITPTKKDDFVVLRSKTPTPTRPQSIHSTTTTTTGGGDMKTSPLVPKPPIADKSNIAVSPRTSVNVVAIDRKFDYVPMSKYTELLERVSAMESKMNQLQSQVDELEGRLKVESDLRRHFQVELEKVAQCVTQV